MAHCRNEKPCWSDSICRYTGNCPNKVKTFSDSIKDMNESNLCDWLTNIVQDTMQRSGYYHGVEYYENFRAQLIKELSKEI